MKQITLTEWEKWFDSKNSQATETIHADSREESVEVIDHFEGLAESEEKDAMLVKMREKTRDAVTNSKQI